MWLGWETNRFSILRLYAAPTPCPSLENRAVSCVLIVYIVQIFTAVPDDWQHGEGLKRFHASLSSAISASFLEHRPGTSPRSESSSIMRAMVHGAFPRNPRSIAETLGGLCVWCVNTLKNLSKPYWTDEKEARIVRAINIILNHTD